MGIYLNSDNSIFQEYLNNKIYVDHSMLIEYTNSLIGTGEKYICVSRPRRFGKSTDADMLVAYYSKGCDSHNQFNNLKIAETEDYQKHLNKHNVIKIDMYNFVGYIKEYQSLKRMDELLRNDIIEAFTLPKSCDSFQLALDMAYNKTHEKFIFIIDEWDSIIREYTGDLEMQIKYLDYLRILLKDRSYVNFVYMTGILPIKKYGNESGLNMFDEITFAEPRRYEKFTGFTEDEVKELCIKHDMPFEDIKNMYCGYHFYNGTITYNPWAIVYALTKKRCNHYWTRTQTYEMLRDYLNTGFNLKEDFKEDVFALLEGKEVRVDIWSFRNDISGLQSKDEVLTLLIHLGYLGYNEKNKTAYIPNEEIKDEFKLCVRALKW